MALLVGPFQEPRVAPKATVEAGELGIAPEEKEEEGAETGTEEDEEAGAEAGVEEGEAFAEEDEEEPETEAAGALVPPLGAGELSILPAEAARAGDGEPVVPPAACGKG